MTTAVQRLANKIASQSTDQLITVHRIALGNFWAAVDSDDKAEADAHFIVTNAIGDEFIARDVPCTDCCFCPIEGGYHDDPRGCDLTSADSRTA